MCLELNTDVGSFNVLTFVIVFCFLSGKTGQWAQKRQGQQVFVICTLTAHTSEAPYMQWISYIWGLLNFTEANVTTTIKIIDSCIQWDVFLLYPYTWHPNSKSFVDREVFVTKVTQFSQCSRFVYYCDLILIIERLFFLLFAKIWKEVNKTKNLQLSPEICIKTVLAYARKKLECPPWVLHFFTNLVCPPKVINCFTVLKTFVVWTYVFGT